MSNDPIPRRRKTRTRAHVIADLGVNFVERQILLAGYTADRVLHDYGLDLMMKTFSDAGEVEGGFVGIQVKSTDHFVTHAGGATAPVRVATADARAWMMEWMPVALVVYDAAADRAFWLDVQEYGREYEIDEDPGGATVTLRVPVTDTFDGRAVARLRERKTRDTRPT